MKITKEQQNIINGLTEAVGSDGFEIKGESKRNLWVRMITDMGRQMDVEITEEGDWRDVTNERIAN